MLSALLSHAFLPKGDDGSADKRFHLVHPDRSKAPTFRRFYVCQAAAGLPVSGR
jgi:hypothetical protein